MAPKKRTEKTREPEDLQHHEAYLSKITKKLYQQNLELAYRNKTLSLLKNLYDISISTLELDLIAKKITEAVCRSLNFELVSLLILNQEQRVMQPLANAASVRCQTIAPGINSGSFFPIIPLNAANNPCITAVRERKMQKADSLNEIFRQEKKSLKVLKFEKEANIKSLLIYPLINQERAIGILIISLNRVFAELSLFEKEAIESIISIITIALDKALIYEQLQHANEHLKDLDKAKSEFMSITSHQLRTPLTGIMGYLSMIIEGDYGKVKANQEEVLTEVFEASQRLIRMVNLFLNITRIEAGRFNFFWQETDIYDLIKDQVHELLPNAKKKGLILELAPAPKELNMVKVDRDKVKDVILNLVDNAIKYTEKGSIKVNVARKDAKNFEIIIKDTGIGIDPQEAEKLFEKFTRGDGMAKINPNGAGLGLFIAKKMVEGHHGKVWVESEGVGKGSEFHVVLPIKQV